MKLLDWMHQKVRKGGIIPFKNRSTTGPIGSCYPCISKHDEAKHATYNTLHTSNWKENRYEVEAAQHEVIEESFAESPVIFQGFLSIGFLGVEPIISEPVTPTFYNLNVGQFSVTENELRFINDELEKFLENEANEEISATGSSGRNSQASVISLANMQLQGDDSHEQEPMTICPLQDYLFGSTIEMPHSGREEVKKKMSLRELFHENEQSEKYPDENECKEENINTKKHNKFTLLSIKKLLKKHKSPNKPRPDEGEFTATSKRNKFNKILKMLCRKVHPERNNEIHFTAHSEQDGKFRQSTNDGSDTGERNDIISTASGLFAGNKEQWIKTDTDYFVLEL